MSSQLGAFIQWPYSYSFTGEEPGDTHTLHAVTLCIIKQMLELHTIIIIIVATITVLILIMAIQNVILFSW